jgi:hypothetical protein
MTINLHYRWHDSTLFDVTSEVHVAEGEQDTYLVIPCKEDTKKTSCPPCAQLVSAVISHNTAYIGHP